MIIYVVRAVRIRCECLKIGLESNCRSGVSNDNHLDLCSMMKWIVLRRYELINYWVNETDYEMRVMKKSEYFMPICDFEVRKYFENSNITMYSYNYSANIFNIIIITLRKADTYKKKCNYCGKNTFQLLFCKIWTMESFMPQTIINFNLLMYIKCT